MRDGLKWFMAWARCAAGLPIFEEATRLDIEPTADLCRFRTERPAPAGIPGWREKHNAH